MNTNHKKLLALILCAALLFCLFSGCKSEQDKFYDELMSARPSPSVTPEGSPSPEASADPVSPDDSPTPAPTPTPKPLSGTLRIGASDSVFIGGLVNGFMERYPGVTIETDFEFTESDGGAPLEEQRVRYRNFAQRQLMELVSGAAPDVFAPSFNHEKVGKQGLLYDLNEMIDNDPDFRREDYFENIFTAMEQNGKLYVLPRTISISYIVIGIPGGIMPLSEKYTNDFGILAFMVANALQPDFTVLSLNFDHYVEGFEYYDIIKNVPPMRFGYPADVLNVASSELFWVKHVETADPVFLRHTDEEIRDYLNRLPASQYDTPLVSLRSEASFQALFEMIVDACSEERNAEVVTQREFVTI